MTLDIDEVVEVLSPMEKMVCIGFCDLIFNNVVDDDINTLVAVPLGHLIQIDTAIFNIQAIHDVENSCNTN